MVLKKIRALLGRKAARPHAAATEAADAPMAAVTGATSPAPAPSVPIHRGPEVVHHPVSLQDLDPDAVRIVKRLTRFDHTAYLVGGCVRDLLLDRKPKDFDIGTSATPRQIKRLFSNCRIIGRRFRLAHIYFQNGKIIEVATFRAKDNGADADDAAAAPPAETEGDLLIRDDNVFGTPEEDALRRDFTINALFYDVNAETVIDHADGLADLRRKLIRTIGDPAVRFREDPIRILRAVKFAARLDFGIESATLTALCATRGEIPKAAPPRVLEEFNRFCRGGAGRRSFELCFETGVFEIILPEVAALYAEDGIERRVLFALLDAIDRRWAEGAVVGTAEIFSALLFASAAPQLGWPLDGVQKPREPRGDTRAIVEALLRPIAVRLRLSRRDQEHTRQTLIILQRMVPWKPLRRGTRLALMRRPAFADALAMLEALSPVLGGVFAAAATAWRESLAVPAGHGVGAPPAREPAAERNATATASDAAPDGRDGGASEGERRRRGRRGGRRRRRDRGASPVETPAPSPRPTATMPPVWDDNYFFAALPSVPKRHTEAKDGDTDRYGADVVATAGLGDADEHPGATPHEGHANPSPRKARRRRGGRGRRKPGPILPEGDSSSPDGGES